MGVRGTTSGTAGRRCQALDTLGSGRCLAEIGA
jgi:hypothetical protein